MAKLTFYHLEKENWKEALKYVDGLLKIDKNAAFLYVRGEIHFKMEQYYEALIDYSEAIQKNPMRQYYSHRSACYIALGMKE